VKLSAKIGVIGGSGVYDLPAIKDRREIAVKTPFGAPSGKILLGTLEGARCAFLPRHGKGHVLLPHEINVRANIWALKSLGVERVLAVAAVGSLKEELPPRHFVVPDQIVDKTWGRPSTFFGEGCVGHVAFDKPFCEPLARDVFARAQRLGIKSTYGGAYVCMQGPLFSTRAESEQHRGHGWDVIGMTAATEAKLAREAELCYALVALVTDYDCWKQGEEVSSHQVVETMKANVVDAQRLLAAALPAAAALERGCACGSAMRHAVVTNPKMIPAKTRKKLDLIIGRYL
jgi:5'-methylthioadenosine phosphorylase